MTTRERPLGSLRSSPPHSVHFPLHALGAFPSPLWGGVRGGGRCVRQRRRITASPPSPPLPHKGGGSRPRSRRRAEGHGDLSRSFPRKRESSPSFQSQVWVPAFAVASGMK